MADTKKRWTTGGVGLTIVAATMFSPGLLFADNMAFRIGGMIAGFLAIVGLILCIVGKVTDSGRPAANGGIVMFVLAAVSQVLIYWPNIFPQ